jgi:formylglycine-generating enzyme required for sulfatase activity
LHRSAIELDAFSPRDIETSGISMKKILPGLICCLLGASRMTLAQSGGTAPQPPVPLAGLPAASITTPFVNSLGMKFVPVPGTNVLFSIWDTRVQDYRAYAEANPGVDPRWKTPWSWMGPTRLHEAFTQGDDHPAIDVSWEDAKAFCAWLTKKERGEGKIGPGAEYRLPFDREWTAAVGPAKYPWGGDVWPPPRGVANYWERKWDDFEYTSPVGSFAPNRYGLYDMGGNVWQLCEDWYRGDMNDPGLLARRPGLKNDGGGMKFHVMRGSSWHMGDADDTLSAYHLHAVNRSPEVGFRCVLASGPSAP